MNDSLFEWHFERSKVFMSVENIIPEVGNYDCIIITGTCGSGKTTLAAKLAAKTRAYLYTEDKVFAKAIESGRIPFSVQQNFFTIQALRLETLESAFATHAKVVCDIHLHTTAEVKWFLDVIDRALSKEHGNNILIIKLFPSRETSEKFLKTRAEKRAKGKNLAEATFARFIEAQNLIDLDSQRADFQEVLKTSFGSWSNQRFSVSEITITDPTQVSIQ